eukprot:8760481-Alexandrium_andersonii.AAC.1
MNDESLLGRRALGLGPLGPPRQRKRTSGKRRKAAINELPKNAQRLPSKYPESGTPESIYE